MEMIKTQQPSNLKPNKDEFKACSITLNPIKRVASSKTDTHEIRVFLLFRRWCEVCLNPECLTQEDRNTLWKEPFNNKVFEASFVIKPENPDMVESYITNALRTCKKSLPAYGVSSGVLRFVIAKVSRCLQENVVFDKDLQALKFELGAVVDVSTILDAGHA